MARRTYEKARALPEEDHYLPRRKLRQTPIVEVLIVAAIVGLLGLAYWSSRDDDASSGLGSEVAGDSSDRVDDGPSDSADGEGTGVDAGNPDDGEGERPTSSTR